MLIPTQLSSWKLKEYGSWALICCYKYLLDVAKFESLLKRNCLSSTLSQTFNPTPNKLEMC